MLDINLMKFEGMNVGPQVTGIGVAGDGSEKVKPTWPPGDLDIPWHTLQDTVSIFSFLSWHTRISTFSGREKEIDNLTRWANSSPPVSIKFVTGEGGVGKSRLAAEFAERMKAKDWTSGFVKLEKVQSFQIRRNGNLLIVDYPEENYKSVVELLKDAASLNQKIKFRVLFLTRRSVEEWINAITEARALTIADMEPIAIGRIDKTAYHTLFSSAQERTGKELGTCPEPVSEDDLYEWVNSAAENYRSLLVVAAGVYSAIDVKCEILSYNHKQIIEALVNREISSFHRIAEQYGFHKKDTIAKLVALAAFAGELTPQTIEKLIALPSAGLDFPKHKHWHDILEETKVLSNGVIPAAKPDIFAAALASIVLGNEPKLTPELMWLSMEDDIEQSLERLARLSYDAGVVTGFHEHKISQWLAKAVENKPDRCSIVDGIFSVANIPIGWQPAAIAAYKTLLRFTDDDEEKGQLLSNLSVMLSFVGKNPQALDTIREAVEIYRRLAKNNPARFEPDLARSLNNFSTILSDVGENAKALNAISEAVKIYRRLAKDNPARFEPDLARSKGVLGKILRSLGKREEACKILKEGILLLEKFANAPPNHPMARLRETLIKLLQETGCS